MINTTLQNSLRGMFKNLMLGRCWILDGSNTLDASRSQIRVDKELLTNRIGQNYPINCGMQEIQRIPNQNTPGESELANTEYIVKLPVGTLVNVQDVIKVVEVVDGVNIITYIDVILINRGRAGALTWLAHGQKRE